MTYRAPEVIEVLSDNGSAYTAKDTRIFARQLGLKPCFTPVASPQSNGMSEAFVKTLKRDYVRVNPLPDAETILKLIGDWIEDYNESHPPVFVKAVVRRFHAASLISGAPISVSGLSQTGPAGCQLRVLPDHRCGFFARAIA